MFVSYVSRMRRYIEWLSFGFKHLSKSSTYSAIWINLKIRCKYFTLTPIQPGEVKVDLANFDVKFWTKFLCRIFKKLTYSCRNVLQIFLNLWHDVKKWCLNVHLEVFSSEVGPRRHIGAPPLPLSFTVYTDHIRAGEVPPGRGPQSGVAPVNIPTSFRSWAA